MELNIFNSILFRTLRPWLVVITPAGDLINVLKPANTRLTESYADLHKQLVNLLSIFPEDQKTIIAKSANNEIALEPDFYQISQYYSQDNLSKYFFSLITKEAKRILIDYCREVEETPHEVDKIYSIKIILKHIKFLLIEAGKVTQHTDNDNGVKQYALTTLFRTLFKLYFEIQDRYAYLLIDIETVESLLNSFPGTSLELKPTQHLYEWQLKNLLSTNSVSEGLVRKILKAADLNSSEEFLQVKAALENLIFIQRNETSVADLTMDKLIEKSFINDHFGNIQASHISYFNSGAGLTQLDKIQNEIDELNYIDSTCINNLSIPQRLFKWLHSQKDYINITPTIVNQRNFIEKAIDTPNLHEEYNSFTYIDLATNPGKLTTLFTSLKAKGMIDKSTPASDFKAIFSGKEITNPVIWIGGITTLNYFIKAINAPGKRKLNDLKNRLWLVTCKCFIPPDGSTFNRDNLRTAKKPASDKQTIIDMLVNNL